MAITDEIPRSRITLTYRTNVHGEPEEVTLPFRVLVMGDLSRGTSRDRALPLDKRQIRRLDGKNLNQVIADMGLSLSLTVKNRINPTVSDSLDVKLPITSVKSFLPAEVAKSVPRIRALLLLRRLLLEAQATFDNRKEFRALLREATTNDDRMKGLTQELAKFENYRIPAAKLRLIVPKEVLALPNLEIRRATLVPNPLLPANGHNGAATTGNGKSAPAEAGADGKGGTPAGAKAGAAEVAPSTQGMLLVDEQLIDKALYNHALRLKPGMYEIRVFAPDYASWSQVVTVKHDQTVELTVGPLKAIS